MEMTHAEIRRNYREAKNKKDQIQILADLNLCTVAEIKEILNEKPRLETKKAEKSKKAEDKTSEKPKKIKHGPMPEIAKKVLYATLDSIEAKIKQYDVQISEQQELKKAAEQDYRELAEFMKVRKDEC
jgi:formate dehydrogenase maturation protein FdhE